MKRIHKVNAGHISLVALLLCIAVLSGCDSPDTPLSLAKGAPAPAATQAAAPAAVHTAVNTNAPDTLLIATTEPSATVTTDSFTPTAIATATPYSTNTAVPPPTQVKAGTPTEAPPTSTRRAKATSTLPDATPTSPDEGALGPTPEAQGSPTGGPVSVNGHTYDAYLQAATKQHQLYHYSCEFDAAWVVLKTYGYDVSLDEQLAIVGVDTSIEPYYEETPHGVLIHGGDIINHYSGDYKTNFLARTTGFAIRRVFEHYGLTVTAVHDKGSLEDALLRGELVWIKTTADFKPGRPSTWIMPDGSTYQTVLGNDHAAVVIGFNSDVVVIRDVLGPTSTNLNRKYEYEVPWSKFLAAWGSQSYDGLAVAPPSR